MGKESKPDELIQHILFKRLFKVGHSSIFMWDFKREAARKLVHFCVSIIVIIISIYIAQNYGKTTTLLFLSVLLALVLVSEYFRVDLKKNISFVSFLYRSKESKRFGGQVFFLISGIIAYAVFDFRIALAAILMTSLGDLTSCLVGRGLGRVWITKTRNLEGVLAEFVIDLGIAYFIIGEFWIMLVMALVATIVETLVHELDDNLYVPVFAGLAGQLVG